MKLSPETVRLRRIAKAHAAGEFSQSEYRAARREVIVNFRAMPLDDDDTQPRAPTGEIEAVGLAVPAGARRPWRRWALLVLAGLAALAAAQTFAASMPAPLPGPAQTFPALERL